MFYESAARADEVLCLNVEDLYPQDKRGRITVEGGATGGPGSPTAGRVLTGTPSSTPPARPARSACSPLRANCSVRARTSGGTTPSTR
ncbi:hypothetical protein GCM10010295_25380 [Streptomyces intermedius]